MGASASLADHDCPATVMPNRAKVPAYPESHSGALGPSCSMVLGWAPLQCMTPYLPQTWFGVSDPLLLGLIGGKAAQRMWVVHQVPAGPSQQGQPAIGPQMLGGIYLNPGSWEGVYT